MRGTLQGCGPD